MFVGLVSAAIISVWYFTVFFAYRAYERYAAKKDEEKDKNDTSKFGGY